MADMLAHPLLTYKLGFKIGSTNIPDPTSFSGKESDLDTMGERDATGYLHRNKVATKHPVNLEYNNIPWAAIVALCGLMTSAQFQFTFPDPFSANQTRTITAYAGDRDFSAVFMPHQQEWYGNLKVSIIEY